MTDVVNAHCLHLLTLQNLKAGTVLPLSLHPEEEQFLLHLGHVLCMTSQKEGELRWGVVPEHQAQHIPSSFPSKRPEAQHHPELPG